MFSPERLWLLSIRLQRSRALGARVLAQAAEHVPVSQLPFAERVRQPGHTPRPQQHRHRDNRQRRDRARVKIWHNVTLTAGRRARPPSGAGRTTPGDGGRTTHLPPAASARGAGHGSSSRITCGSGSTAVIVAPRGRDAADRARRTHRRRHGRSPKTCPQERPSWARLRACWSAGRRALAYEELSQRRRGGRRCHAARGAE